MCQPQMQTCLTPEVCRQIDPREGVGRQAVSWEPNHGRAPYYYRVWGDNASLWHDARYVLVDSGDIPRSASLSGVPDQL